MIQHWGNLSAQKVHVAVHQRHTNGLSLQQSPKTLWIYNLHIVSYCLTAILWQECNTDMRLYTKGRRLESTTAPSTYISQRGEQSALSDRKESVAQISHTNELNACSVLREYFCSVCPGLSILWISPVFSISGYRSSAHSSSEKGP